MDQSSDENNKKNTVQNHNYSKQKNTVIVIFFCSIRKFIFKFTKDKKRKKKLNSKGEPIMFY